MILKYSVTRNCWLESHAAPVSPWFHTRRRISYAKLPMGASAWMCGCAWCHPEGVLVLYIQDKALTEDGWMNEQTNKCCWMVNRVTTSSSCTEGSPSFFKDTTLLQGGEDGQGGWVRKAGQITRAQQHKPVHFTFRGAVSPLILSVGPCTKRNATLPVLFHSKVSQMHLV